MTSPHREAEEKIKVGDKIRVGQLETICEGFANLNDQRMICTPYGNFAIKLVSRISQGDPHDR